MFDLLEEASDVKTDKLFAIVLGSSGAGKSFVCGTAPGKILFLHLSSERHGVTAACQSGGVVIGVCIDTDKTGTPLKPADAFKRGLECLNPAALKKAGIETVVIDGLTELEKVVRGTTKWANACQSAAGKHNSFAEPAATVAMLDEYIAALRTAQDQAGVHVIVTGILDVQEIDDNGAIGVAKPRLSGYSVAESMLQQFPDILVIGKITKKDGTSGRVFQTTAEMHRVSKDETGKVKKFINFDPRLSNVKVLPQYIKADFAEVLKLKTGAK